MNENSMRILNSFGSNIPSLMSIDDLLQYIASTGPILTIGYTITTNATNTNTNTIVNRSNQWIIIIIIKFISIYCTHLSITISITILSTSSDTESRISRTTTYIQDHVHHH